MVLTLLALPLAAAEVSFAENEFPMSFYVGRQNGATSVIRLADLDRTLKTYFLEKSVQLLEFKSLIEQGLNEAGFEQLKSKIKILSFVHESEFELSLDQGSFVNLQVELTAVKGESEKKMIFIFEHTLDDEGHAIYQISQKVKLPKEIDPEQKVQKINLIGKVLKEQGLSSLLNAFVKNLKEQ